MYQYTKFEVADRTSDEVIDHIVNQTKTPREIVEQIRVVSDPEIFGHCFEIEFAVSSNEKGYFVCAKGYDGDGHAVNTKNNAYGQGALFSNDGTLIETDAYGRSYYVQMDSSFPYEPNKTYMFVPLIVSNYGLFESMYTVPVINPSLYRYSNTCCVVNGKKYRSCYFNNLLSSPIRTIFYPITV